MQKLPKYSGLLLSAQIKKCQKISLKDLDKRTKKNKYNYSGPKLREKVD